MYYLLLILFNFSSYLQNSSPLTWRHYCRGKEHIAARGRLESNDSILTNVPCWFRLKEDIYQNS